MHLIVTSAVPTLLQHSALSQLSRRLQQPTKPITRHVLTLPQVMMMTRMETMLPLRIHSKFALLKDQLSDTTALSVLTHVPVVAQISQEVALIATHNSRLERWTSLLPPLLRHTGKDGLPPLPTPPPQPLEMQSHHSSPTTEMHKVWSTGALEI